MIERPRYLEQLERRKDRDVIKVVTGVRRCGKSTLMQMFAELCRRYNLSMVSAVNMIICECIESGRLPFEFVEKAKETSREIR